MKRILILFALFTCISFRLTAQDDQQKTSGFFSDFLADMKQAEEKVIPLAEAVPEDKYTWRPAEGVRSVSEVYMHIAGGNYFLMTFLGAKMPEGLTQESEKTVTKKADVVKWLKDSYKAVNDFVSTMKESDLDQKITFFKNEMSKRMMLFVIMNHSHEHLGQSIAYARSNGITPPWSMASN